MAHMPVNHHLRPLYRFLAMLCGLYVLTFGVVAYARTSGLGVFQQDGLPAVLGLRANQAFAVLSILAGLVIIGGVVIGRNVDRMINLYGGIAFLVMGMAMMSLMQSNANLFGFTMTTCIVSFVIGLVLLAAGLYGRVGSSQEQFREERFRHSAGPDTKAHAYDYERGPKPPEQTEKKRFA